MAKRIKNSVALRESGMDLTSLCLTRLGLENYIPLVRKLLLENEDNNIPASEFLENVLEAIISVRDSQKAQMRMKMARFPTQATVEKFDFSRINKEVKVLVSALCDSFAWMEHHENILFKGLAGVGKTHLSIALGRQATSQGYSTLFISANELFESLTLSIERNTYTSKLRLVQRNDLLIIDDLGIPVQAKPVYGKIFYDLMQGRNHKKSTIITTNRKVTDWFAALGGDTASVRAGLDRFLESCHRVDIRGRSYRLESFKKINSMLQKSKEDIKEDKVSTDEDLSQLEGLSI